MAFENTRSVIEDRVAQYERMYEKSKTIFTPTAWLKAAENQPFND
jgi:hypothetical protein